MKKIKEILHHFFIDGLTGMAWGLFSTLIIGLIITQIASFIPGEIGKFLNIIGKITSSLTGAGIGVGVATKFKSGAFTTVSAGIAGMIGAFASKIIAGTLYTSDGGILLSGPGEPLGAFLAAIVAIEFGNLLTGKTKIDIILVPLVSIIAGATVGLLIGPPISNVMTALGNLINWSVEQQPILMGILVSVIMGMVLTLPISSAAIAIILNLNGLAAGAATVGCCANMIGFAVASYKENKVSGLISQGLGTSMLQVPNIIKKPLIWLPAIVASAVLRSNFNNNIKNDKQCFTEQEWEHHGLVGPLMTWQDMQGSCEPLILIIKIVAIQFVLPTVIAGYTGYILRKRNIIKNGDMKLEN